MALNHYPRWKNILITGIVCLGLVYALPNVFGEDPAVQISSLKTVDVDDSTQARIKVGLQNAGIKYTVEQQNHDLMLRFTTTTDQLAAKDLLVSSLGPDYMVALNLAPAIPKFLRVIGASPMKLGLDLRGGVHFLLQVDMQAAFQRHLDGYAQTLRARLREEKLHYRAIDVNKLSMQIRFSNKEDQLAAMTMIKQEAPGLDLEPSTQADAFYIKATLSLIEQKNVQNYAIEQSMNTLRNRVNELGVAEALVQRQGADRIVIELPGIQDTAHAKEILGKTASISFYIIDNDHNPRDYVNARPPGGTVMFNDRQGQPHIFDRRVVLTGDSIVGAQPGADEMGQPSVSIQLGGNTREFSRITGENINKQMGTVFIETRYHDVVENGQTIREPETTYEVISIATIRSRLGNRFQITGLNGQESRNLALLLRAGALPAPIDIVEERIVGPSMGLENIKQGMLSLVVGLGLVLSFMMAYYRAFGVIANIALLSNLVLLVAVLSIIDATLTLPGIAALVLTMGMAVDANVLIFERIREELRAGQGPQASIQAGYEKAFVTIVDANLTTFIAGLSLFSIGSGPIKGFAIILIIGLVTSVFSSVTVSRVIVNMCYGGRRLDKISIGI
jgi:preprotein translocase subunit SecD